MILKEHYMSQTDSEGKKIAIHTCKDLMIYAQNEIAYLKAEGRYTRIFFKSHMKNKSIICTKLLRNFESILSNNFIRIHRSYIVNISFITKILRKKVLVLGDGTELPIARKRYSSVEERIFMTIPAI